ncbi:hypothetical protein BH18ACT4_BH18ACT4_15750 [soil metagenome]
MSEVRDSREPVDAIAALEKQLAETSRSVRPLEHAAVAYRLGLAYAESPSGNPTENLRKALACYEVTAAIFDPRYDPVEHARALNAAGAAQRGLGRHRRAAELFKKAAELFEGRERDDERAAALNNLGLVRTELGEIDAALEAFAVAAELFDQDSAEGRRGRAAALHNRGQAHAATSSISGLKAALADYAEARASADSDEAPYHLGRIDHSTCTAATAFATLLPDEKRRLLSEAITAFESSLSVFTSNAFPYQHALAKHNLGRALAATGEVTNLRRALACYEDTMAVLDPRLHGDAWRQAFASMEAAEAELARVGATGTIPGRVGQFAALIAEVDDAERVRLLRERMKRLLPLPAEARYKALVELALASVALGWDAARAHIEPELNVLMEFPNEGVEVGLQARVDAHRRLPEAEREVADRALDQAVGDALGLTQRMLVRDYLTSLGFERP